jgi:hypothetical protein
MNETERVAQAERLEKKEKIRNNFEFPTKLEGIKSNLQEKITSFLRIDLIDRILFVFALVGAVIGLSASIIQVCDWPCEYQSYSVLGISIYGIMQILRDNYKAILSYFIKPSNA